MDAVVSSVNAPAATTTTTAEKKPSIWARFKGWLGRNGLDMAIGGLVAMIVGLALSFVPVAYVAFAGLILYIGGWLVGMLGLVGALVRSLA